MSEFEQALADWRDFFMLTGTASATLLGLLFVAVSLRPDIRGNQASFRRRAVEHNFSNFLYVLLFSLYFVVPGMDDTSLGWTILVTCLFPLIGLGRSAIRFRSSSELDAPAWFWVFAVPGVCFVAAVGVAITFIVHDDSEVMWFLPVIALLLTVPTHTAWNLMMGSLETG